MAPIIGALPGTYFTLRIYRKLSTNPLLVFGNILEFVNRETVVETSANQLIDRWSEFFRLMSLGDVEMDRAVLSTWVEDGEPYDPQSFITRPLGGSGERVAGGQPMSLNNCLFMRKQTLFGQNGKVFLRRFLTEEDTDAPSGTLRLVNPAGVQTEITNAVTAAAVQTYFDNTGEFQMVMKSSLLLEREVSEFQAAGARVMQFNNRYFDVP